MRPEVQQYFETNFGGFSGFINVGRRQGIDAESIRKACELVYDGITESDSRIHIGQRVQAYARKLARQKTDRSERRFDSMDARILALENARFGNRVRRAYDAFINWSKYG